MHIHSKSTKILQDSVFLFLFPLHLESYSSATVKWKLQNKKSRQESLKGMHRTIWKRCLMSMFKEGVLPWSFSHRCVIMFAADGITSASSVSGGTLQWFLTFDQHKGWRIDVPAAFFMDGIAGLMVCSFSQAITNKSSPLPPVLIWGGKKEEGVTVED